jgi:hypothetical protein
MMNVLSSIPLLMSNYAAPCEGLVGGSVVMAAQMDTCFAAYVSEDKDHGWLAS